MTADWVARHRSDEHVVLVEITDGGPGPTGWIPGAVSLNWRTDLQHPVRRDVPDAAQIAATLGSLGIGPDDTIVLYSGNSNWWATAAFWLLRVYGHRDLRLLDGGRARWEAQGGELTFRRPERPPTAYPVPTADLSLRATRTDVLDGIGRINLLDVRSLPEYLGDRTTPPDVPEDLHVRPGHVQSAQHFPWDLHVRPDGCFRTPEELRAVYAELDTTVPTVVYCRIGWRSSLVWFVLHELLGLPNVRNYDGSWQEFGAMVGAPVVRGPLPWGEVRGTNERKETVDA
ncbi:sulfurtransferase [Kitasatospora saccharophila]|uniref:sulfurtransferase n=1 Tax=Kitasatospora saccharophila TaxID=407973 RepID=UPI0031DC5EC2